MSSRVRVRVRIRVRVRVLGLGIGFRVPIRNIIGGAAAAHIPMTLGHSPTSCERNEATES